MRCDTRYSKKVSIFETFDPSVSTFCMYSVTQYKPVISGLKNSAHLNTEPSIPRAMALVEHKKQNNNKWNSKKI